MAQPENIFDATSFSVFILHVICMTNTFQFDLYIHLRFHKNASYHKQNFAFFELGVGYLTETVCVQTVQCTLKGKSALKRILN